MISELQPDGTIIYITFGRVGDRPYVFEDVDPDRLERITRYHVELTSRDLER